MIKAKVTFKNSENVIVKAMNATSEKILEKIPFHQWNDITEIKYIGRAE